MSNVFDNVFNAAGVSPYTGDIVVDNIVRLVHSGDFTAVVNMDRPKYIDLIDVANLFGCILYKGGIFKDCPRVNIVGLLVSNVDSIVLDAATGILYNRDSQANSAWVSSDCTAVTDVDVADQLRQCGTGCHIINGDMIDCYAADLYNCIASDGEHFYNVILVDDLAVVPGLEMWADTARGVVDSIWGHDLRLRWTDGAMRTASVLSNLEGGHAIFVRREDAADNLVLVYPDGSVSCWGEWGHSYLLPQCEVVRFDALPEYLEGIEE